MCPGPHSYASEACWLTRQPLLWPHCHPPLAGRCGAKKPGQTGRPSWQPAWAHGYQLSSLSGHDRTRPGPAAFQPPPASPPGGTAWGQAPASSSPSRGLSVTGEGEKTQLGANFTRLVPRTCRRPTSRQARWDLWAVDPGLGAGAGSLVRSPALLLPTRDLGESPQLSDLSVLICMKEGRALRCYSP